MRWDQMCPDILRKNYQDEELSHQVSPLQYNQQYKLNILGPAIEVCHLLRTQ